MASVLISRNYSKAEKERTKKAPFLGLVAFPPGFEPGAFRLGVWKIQYPRVHHNVM